MLWLFLLLLLFVGLKNPKIAYLFGKEIKNFNLTPYCFLHVNLKEQGKIRKPPNKYVYKIGYQVHILEILVFV